MHSKRRARALLCLIQAICSRSPLLKGTCAVTNHPRVSELVADAGIEEFACRLRSGVEVRVRLQDYNGRIIALFGLVEPAITKLIRTLLADDVSCLLDIGANYGAVGLNCVSRDRAGLEVHLFEPQPDLCNRIRAALLESPLCANVHLHECAISDQEGELAIAVDPMHTGTACLGGTAMALDGGVPAARVRVVDAAHYLPALLKGRSFGAKVDVEGGEMAVLPTLFRQPNLRFCVFESNDIWNKIAIWEQIVGAGFRLYSVRNGLLRPRLAELRSVEEMLEADDFLAIARDVPSLRRVLKWTSGPAIRDGGTRSVFTRP